MAPHPGAALHREPRRLVDGDHVVIAVDDQLVRAGEVAGIGGRAHRPAPWRRGAERRHANFLPRRQPRRRPDTRPVDPDLAGAQQLLEPAMGKVGEMLTEPPVEAPVGVGVGDLDGLDAGHGSPARLRRSLSQYASLLLISRSKPRSTGV